MHLTTREARGPATIEILVVKIGPLVFDIEAGPLVLFVKAKQII